MHFVCQCLEVLNSTKYAIRVKSWTMWPVSHSRNTWLIDSLILKNGVNLKRFPERAHQAIPTVEKFLFFIPSRVNGNGNWNSPNLSFCLYLFRVFMRHLTNQAIWHNLIDCILTQQPSRPHTIILFTHYCCHVNTFKVNNCFL